MSAIGKMTPATYLASLKEARDPQSFQEAVLGVTYTEGEALDEAHEALIDEGEEAGDFEEHARAAEAFCKATVLAWAQDDSRLIENFSIQALYYGTLAGLDALIENYSTVWAIWAHLLPNLKPRERMRLQDFARFRRSLQLGLRERDETDERLNATVSLLASTFESMGALNVKAIDDRTLDLTDDIVILWEEASQLLAQVKTSE